jgi:hypothetical protein
MLMPAANNTAPLHPAPSRQAGVVRAALAAISFPLRLSLHSVLPSEVSRPMAVLDITVQSREADRRPAPGTGTFPLRVPGRVARNLR